MIETNSAFAARADEGAATVLAGDYLNKLAGEKIERECRERLMDGCRELVLDLSETELVNSIGVSILLGVIDTASGVGARVVIAGVNEPTAELFQMLGVARHAEVIPAGTQKFRFEDPGL